MNKRAFQTKVKHYYKERGRDLPWRSNLSTYRVVVSEFMLQQTQVDRVTPHFRKFVNTYPNWKKLSEAPLGEVLREWQGLGYNRRAKYLHQMAKRLVEECGSKLPRTAEALESFSGIGPYTARAILAFAYDEPQVFIETNIRTVFIHHFFQDHQRVGDKEILSKIEETLDTKAPREWYFALMDYGAHLKKEGVKSHTKSDSYKKQTPFKGSGREIRGAIIRVLSGKKRGLKRSDLYKVIQKEPGIIDLHIEKMVSEGLMRTSKKSDTLML